MLAVSSLAVGAHSITAAYSGDGNNAAATSPILTQTVTKISATVALIVAESSGVARLSPLPPNF